MLTAPADWIAIGTFAVGAIATWLAVRRDKSRAEPETDDVERLAVLEEKVRGCERDIARLDRELDAERGARHALANKTHVELDAVAAALGSRIDYQGRRLDALFAPKSGR